MKNYLKKNMLGSISLISILIFSLLNMSKAKLLSIKYSNYFIKQLIWILIGFILYFIVSKIKFKKIFKIRYFLYTINIFLLIYVLLFSKSTNGIKAWIKIGSISFQPSELVKITFPLSTIKLIKDKKYFLSFILFLIPSILILLEPDTGNFALILCIYIYLLLNKNNKKYIIMTLIVLFLLLFSSIIIFKYYPTIIINLFNGSLYYRFKRILSYKNNFQINNALIGIGSASLFPINHKKLLIYIPEGITDFIFAFNICNYGIILTIILLIFYFTLTYSILKKYTKRLYYIKRKIIGTFLTIFIIQTSYNILMNIGLLPIMGIPLPFMSYGGSNTIIYFILYALATKKISSIEDKDNNNYKNSFHKGLVDNHN